MHVKLPRLRLALSQYALFRIGTLTRGGQIWRADYAIRLESPEGIIPTIPIFRVVRRLCSSRVITVPVPASTSPPPELLAPPPRQEPHLVLFVDALLEGAKGEWTDEGLHAHSADSIEEVVHGGAARTRRRLRSADGASGGAHSPGDIATGCLAVVVDV